MLSAVTELLEMRHRVLPNRDRVDPRLLWPVTALFRKTH
jgi:hypothetical protein